MAQDELGGIIGGVLVEAWLLRAATGCSWLLWLLSGCSAAASGCSWLLGRS